MMIVAAAASRANPADRTSRLDHGYPVDRHPVHSSERDRRVSAGPLATRVDSRTTGEGAPLDIGSEERDFF